MLTWLATALVMASVPADLSGPHHASQLLYSTQLRFTDTGEPIVTVGLMEGQEEVSITAPSGLIVHLSGPASTSLRLPPGAELKSTIAHATAGETRYRVVVAAHGGGALEAIRDTVGLWSDLNVETESLELGGIVGFPGRVLDNRRVLIVESGYHDSRLAAQYRAEELMELHNHGKPPWVFADSVRHASGSIVTTDLHSGLTISQDDLLSIEAADGGPVTVREVEFGRGYAHHGFEDRRYHGEIIVAIDPNAKLTVVNRLPAELMLRGIVPSEIFPNAPNAALEAQAITARSELLAKLGVQNRAYPYLVCATQQCQVYGGVDKESPGTNRAIKRTRGLMLFDEDGHLLDAVYHASSGGHTEHNEYVWPGSPEMTLRGKFDAPKGTTPPWPEGDIPTERQLRDFLSYTPDTYGDSVGFTNRVLRWTQDIPSEAMDAYVNAKYDVGGIREVRVMSRGVSGRVRHVQFIGEHGVADVHGELRVRRLLGNLKSGMFVVDVVGQTWRFTGGGHGHGVGMSQYGAIGMAERGRSAKQILRHYYNGCKVERTY